LVSLVRTAFGLNLDSFFTLTSGGATVMMAGVDAGRMGVGAGVSVGGLAGEVIGSTSMPFESSLGRTFEVASSEAGELELAIADMNSFSGAGVGAGAAEPPRPRPLPLPLPAPRGLPLGGIATAIYVASLIENILPHFGRILLDFAKM